MAPAVGSEVGVNRWPSTHAHPDAWGRPWRGTVLAPEDPRAWAGTLAFPSGAPGRGEVLAHLLRVGWPEGVVPVLWEFGRVYWERAGSLRPYAEDAAAWEAAHAAARGLESAKGGGQCLASARASAASAAATSRRWRPGRRVRGAGRRRTRGGAALEVLRRELTPGARGALAHLLNNALCPVVAEVHLLPEPLPHLRNAVHALENVVKAVLR